METSRIISNVLTGFILFVHFSFTLIDCFAFFPMASFLIRPDGSRQDPLDMTPQESIMCFLMAFPFGIIVMGFLVADRKAASLLTASVHFWYGLHRFLCKDTWDSLLHPEQDMISIEFFIITHVGWVAMSLLIWYLENKSKDKKD